MVKVEREIGGRKIILETGNLAKQSEGSCLIRYGDTIVLSTVNFRREETKFVSVLPLTVDYREFSYAAGKIPGGFFKREGRPRDTEILTSRLIDRPLRPLFPKNFCYETQIISLLLSFDQENAADFLGIISASSALLLSSLPFNTPVGACRVSKFGSDFVVNPAVSSFPSADLNLVVAGTKDSILMVEGEGKEVSISDLEKALRLATEVIREICELEEEFVSLSGREKGIFSLPEVNPELARWIKEREEEICQANELPKKAEREEYLYALFHRFKEELANSFPNLLDLEEQIRQVMEEILRRNMREKILNRGIRIDGRTPEEIRPISCVVSILPRTHGSCLFTRGETQCLAVVTLGTKEDEQIIDALTGEIPKSFMLHYNFPPFSTGEVKPLRGPSRREIGHGALAERCLEVLLEKDSFPYTIRVVSDILESNGSSSMATVCGACLALMDAGVPIKSHCAGIAMGLIKEEDKYVLLSDILGQEDHYGDMDFKVAGTRKGITGLQLDLKTEKVSLEILTEALKKAEKGIHFIIDIMEKTLSKPREKISEYAPRIVTFKIPKEKIGEVIGPGGKVIRKIIEETGVEINIADDGLVQIAGPAEKQVEEAKSRILAITAEVEVGKIYLGVVKRIVPFGCFVEILPGKEGLCHISQLSDRRIRDVREVVKVGDRVKVKVIKIDEMGRINLSKKQAEGRNFRR
ncbi:MAG: polyribonucleotide nucleotidyltransferase [candidate division WOR-3 bacterium]